MVAKLDPPKSKFGPERGINDDKISPVGLGFKSQSESLCCVSIRSCEVGNGDDDTKGSLDLQC